MWRLVFTVVLWNTITSQPITDEPENNRQTRQIDFVECCPCPGSKGDQMGAASFAPGRNVAFRGNDGGFGGQNLGEAGFARGAVDDCPCRFRGADSEGASSILFPSAVRPVRPILRSDETKDDPKPLLHPEVGLASSFLETLREATDEEYEAALARDAARNEARVSELRDTEPETAKNILTIIVNPRDTGHDLDATPEASHTQETRVHPLASSHSRFSQKELPVFRITPDLEHRNQDMDSGASTVQEQVVELGKGLEGLRLKTSPAVLKLLSAKKPEGNIQSLLKLRNRDGKLSKDESGAEIVEKKLGPKIPALKFPSFLKKNGTASPVKPLNPALKRLDILKLRKPLSLKPKIGRHEDSNTSPSIIQKKVSKAETVSPFDLKSLLPTREAKTPFSLENLLNLKDVELIKPITLPGFEKLLPPLRINPPGTDFKKRSKIGSIADKECDQKAKGINANRKSQRGEIKTEILDVLPAASENQPVVDAENNLDTTEQHVSKDTKNKNTHTEILDTLPSASESNAIMDAIHNDEDDVIPSHVQVVSKSKKAKTEILDALPSASENNEFISNTDENDNEQEEDPTIDKQKQQEINLGEEADTDKFKKDIEDGETNNTNEFDEDEFIEQSDEPISEIEITGFDGDNQQIDFEIQDSDSDVQITNFNAGDIDSITIENGNAGSKEFVEKQNEEFVNGGMDQFEEGEAEEEEESNESFRKDTAGEQEAVEDAIVEPTNLEETFVSTEQRDNKPLQDSFKSEDHSFEDYQAENKPNKNDLLSSIKDRISIKLKTLKNPDTKVLTISRFAQPEAAQSNFEGAKSAFKSDESTDTEIDSLRKDSEQFPISEKSVEINKTDGVTIQDLQKMSKNLLIKSENENIETVSGKDSVEVVQKASLDSNEEAGINSDMDSSAANNFETIDSQKQAVADILETSNEESSFNSNLGRGDTNDELKTCPSNFETPKSIAGETIDKSSTGSFENEENEMASAASAPVFNTVTGVAPLGNFGLPVLRQDIVEPSSLFDVSNLLPVQPIDVSNLNIHLPTLDEIQKGISSILEENAKAAGEDFSPEFTSAEDCSDPVMATDASTTSAKSSLPGLKTLEDVNLDIFRVNPLGQSTPLKIPALNLNSFKTKLALPIDLKPMKLESTLGGKNGGLIGAKLTFGPEKIGKLRKAKPVTKLGSVLNRQGSDILGNPLTSMPSLEELSSKMRASAKSWINSPLTPLEDTLRTTHTLGNSLKTHTENTMRNIQQTLASTLNEAKVTDLNNVGNKFAKPEDLLEHLTSAHEDMNDKLHAIHVDLKDRLSSIHDRIVDHTNLPTLQTPLLSNLGRTEESSLISSKNKGMSWAPKSPPPKLSNKRIIAAKKSPAKTRKPEPKFKIMSSSNTGRNKNEQLLKPYKMSKAASSLAPKRVEVPKLMTTSSKPPFSKPLTRDEKVKLKEPKSLFANEPLTRPRTQFKPFGEFKVSMPATPPPASLKTKSTSTRPKPSASKPVEQSRFSDMRSFATEPKTSQRLPARTISTKPLKTTPLKSSSVSSIRTEKTSSSLSTPLKSSPSKVSPISKLPAFRGVPTLSLPKPTESPLLAKVRDSLRIRIDRPTHLPGKLNSKDVKTPGAHDMARSASENNEMIISPEPMKENVSYKCKMVCVRE